MKRVTINALIDIAGLVTFILTLASGLVLYFFLPSGGGRGGNWVTWMGIPRYEWVLFHDIVSFSFALLLIVHLLLHWRFFRNIRKCFTNGREDACSVPGQE
jgi:hypothetical protein